VQEQTKTHRLMIYITGVLDILVCLLLFISAMYKGAFYKEDTLFINMVICMLGLTCLTVKLVLNIRDTRVITKSKIGSIIDASMLGIGIAYFLPILFNTKASMESALFELTRYINLTIVYFIVRSSKNKKIYLTSIIAIAVVLAAIGIDEITYRAFEETLNSISMGYLEKYSGRLSSTIQYANITALLILVASIILENKIITNMSRIKEKKIGFGLFVALEIFSLILLQTAVILTGSRMNILLVLVSSIIYAIYLFKTDKKRNAATILLLTLASFILVSSIDGYMLVQNYKMVILTYILTLIISLAYVVAYRLFNYESKENVKGVKRDIIKLRYSKTLIALFILISGIILIIIPKSLTVQDDTEKGISISRNIYGNFEGEYDLNLDINVENGNEYSIKLYEIDEEFNRKRIAYIRPKDIVDGKFDVKITVSNNIERLQLVIKVIKCKVTINSFKIDDKNIKLSYMFAPDNLMFRLKDTLTKDSNNLLRMVYYGDAFKLFKLSPFVGHGGEGFKSRYQEVQDESYISSETHSVPLQILVEAGIIGLSIYLIIVVSTYILIFNLIKAKNKNAIVYLLIFSVYVITSLFDLVFSFGIMITLFGVIIGLIVNEYKQKYIVGSDEYKLDNKSTLGMAKIATLSITLMCLTVVTIYSVNMYRASMIVMPDNEDTLSNSYDRVGLLEEKVKLDSYNVDFLVSLITEYSNHISRLNSISITTDVEQDKELLKNEASNYIIRQKEIADKLIEYEYYNKYVLDQVARTYFDNYLSYAQIYNYNFKNREIAYVFYIGYGIKLTKRLTEVGPVNKTALGLAYNIYDEYIPKIEKQNLVINSEMLSSAINDMKNEFNILKEKVGN